MAETYRGLTIQIGADTTKLSKALKASQAALTQTQAELKKVNQGLRFDTTSSALLNAKFEQLSQKAQQTSARLNKMREALKSVNTPELQDVIKNTDNIGLAAENARAKYARIDQELAETYSQLEKIAKANGLAFDRNDIDESISALKEHGHITDETVSKVNELREAHKQAFDETAVYKEVQRVKDLELEIEKTDAELKSYIDTMSSMKPTSIKEVTQALKKLDNEIEDADDSLDVLQREFTELEKAAQISPAGMHSLHAAEKNLEQQSSVLKEKMKSLNSAMNALPVDKAKVANASTLDLAQAAQKARDEFKRANTELAECAGKLQTARQHADNLASSAGKGSAEYKQAQAQVNKLEKEFKQLDDAAKAAGKAMDTSKANMEYRELEVRVQGVANEMGELATKQQQLTNSAGSSNSALKSVGMTLYASVSPAIQQMGSFAIEAGDRIDSAFRDMKKTVNGTDKDFQHLKESALEFSRTNAVSADTILSIEAMGGQLGIAVENLEAFATVSSNLDIATNIDADTIAQSLGQLNGILPDLNDNYAAFGDSLVRLGNNMPAQESAIMDVTSRIGSMGGIVGMTTPEILAWSAAIAATGQNSESAGTAISNTMSDIESAVAGGGESLDAFAKVANMSASDFAKSWNEHPTEAMKSFVEGLKRIDEGGGSVDKTLQDLEITGVRQKQALMGLTQTTDILNDALTMSNDAWNGISDEWGDAGDAAREAAQKSEGFSGALQIMKNSADEFGLELADAMVPFLKMATSALQTATGAFAALPAPVKSGVIALGLAGAAAGALVTAYASFSNILKEHKERQAAANAMTKASVATNKAASASLKAQSGAAAGAATSQGVLGQRTAATTAKMKLMTVQAKVATAGLKALKVAAGIGAMSAVIALTSAIGDAIEKHKNYEKATTGLNSALSSLYTANSKATTSTKESTSANQAARTSVDDLIEAQASLADAIASRNSEAQASISVLSGYQQTISDLSNESSLSSEKVADLKLAVEGVNKECGTNYKVVQDEAGAYKVLDENGKDATDSINKLIDAQKRQIELDAMAETYKDLIKQKGEAAKAYADQLAVVNSKQKELTDLEDRAANGQQGLENQITLTRAALEHEKNELNKLNGAYETASQGAKNYESLQKLVKMASEENASANVKFAASSDQLKASLLNASGSSTSFIAACDAMGLNLEELSKTNNDGLMSMAQSWDGNVATMVSKAGEFGIHVPEEIRKAAEESQNAGNELSNRLAAGIADGSINVNAATKMMQAYAKGDYASLIAEAQKSGIAIPDSLKSGIESGLYSPGDATKRMMSVVALKLTGGNVPEAAKLLGSDIDAGLAEGIRNGTLSAEEAGQLGDDVINKAKETLDSHSPSREFIEIGEDVDKGLEKGISGNQDGPLGALGKLLSSAMDTMNPLKNGMKKTGSQSSSNLATGLSSNVSKVLTSAVNLATNASNGTKTTPKTLGGYGSDASKQFATNLAKQKYLALQNSRAMADSARSSTSGLPGILGGYGSDASRLFASGLRGSIGAAASNSRAMADQGLLMKRDIGSSWTWGNHLGRNWVNGLGAMQRVAYTTALGLANAVRSIIKFSVPEKGPFAGSEKGGKTSGMHLVQNWADGINAGRKYVIEASEGLLQETYDALSDATVTPVIKVHALVTGIDMAHGIELEAAQTIAYANQVASELSNQAPTINETTNETTNNSYFSCGDINITAQDVSDVESIEDFIELVKRAKRVEGR